MEIATCNVEMFPILLSICTASESIDRNHFRFQAAYSNGHAHHTFKHEHDCTGSSGCVQLSLSELVWKKRTKVVAKSCRQVLGSVCRMSSFFWVWIRYLVHLLVKVEVDSWTGLEQCRWYRIHLSQGQWIYTPDLQWLFLYPCLAEHTLMSWFEQ